MAESENANRQRGFKSLGAAFGQPGVLELTAFIGANGAYISRFDSTPALALEGGAIFVAVATVILRNLSTGGNRRAGGTARGPWTIIKRREKPPRKARRR